MSKDSQRRQFLKVATGTTLKFTTTSIIVPSVLRISPVFAGEAQGLLSTPAQTEGPFYPVNDQADKDTDLTRVEGRSQTARGELIRVMGRVTNKQGQLIPDANLEIWQANAAGRYQHIRDRNPAPVDPNFQGWGISRSSSTGSYQFTTIVPGIYPANADWFRPPHIHFKVSRSGYRKLTTQMYFPEQELNKTDLILNSLSSKQVQLLIAKRMQNNADSSNAEYKIPVFVFDIVLENVS